MAVTGKKLSELTDKVETIQGTERIYVSDGTNVPKYIETSQLAKKEDVSELNNKADKILKASYSETTVELQPNKYYVFGEVASLTLTFGAEIPDIYNEYMFQFTSGTTPTTLNLPETIKWIGEHTIEANKTYQVSIVNNIAVLGGA